MMRVGKKGRRNWLDMGRFLLGVTALSLFAGGQGTVWAGQDGADINVARMALDKDGRFLIEIDAVNRGGKGSVVEVRVVPNARLPVVVMGGKTENKEWNARAQGNEIAFRPADSRHAVGPGGVLRARALLLERRGFDQISIFQSREMRRETLLIVIVRSDQGGEQKLSVPVPFIPRLSSSLEKEL